MSAGICVMNKHAVALAADSAVTIGQHAAIHNSANKLFALSQYEPIGVIIYANASFMQVPVEVILKQYKKALGRKSFSTLNEYVTDFISYLEENISLLHFDKTEKGFVGRVYINLLDGLANGYKHFIDEKVAAVKRELTEEELHEIQLKAYEQTVNYIDARNKLQDTDFKSYIQTTYLNDITQYISGNFAWLNPQQTTDLANKICEIYDAEFFRDGYVGFAFAGYGTEEIFPQMCHLHFSGVINGKVRYMKKESCSISERQNAAVKPFAQIDVMQTFLYGINDTVLQDMESEIPKKIEQRINAMDDSYFSQDRKADVLNELQGAATDIIQMIARNATDRYMKPIIQSVATLPIEELALLAESMINITSLRRKVALDSNIGTVGGPIDVAIISKGDGFIWMKRKHYFDLKYNPQYVVTHFSLDNQLSEAENDEEEQ